MKTITITPIAGALDGISQEFLDKWATALESSVQHKWSMCNESGNAYCCLGVAACVELGASIAKTNLNYPEAPMSISHGLFYNGKAGDKRLFVAEVDDKKLTFPDLNDSYLTHPQIAQIIRGEKVTIKVDE